MIIPSDFTQDGTMGMLEKYTTLSQTQRAGFSGTLMANTTVLHETSLNLVDVVPHSQFGWV